MTTRTDRHGRAWEQTGDVPEEWSYYVSERKRGRVRRGHIRWSRISDYYIWEFGNDGGTVDTLEEAMNDAGKDGSA